MAKRDLTLAEIQAKLDELKDKVSAGGFELYAEIKEKVSGLVLESSEKVKEVLEDLGPKLEVLKSKVTVEGQELIDDIKVKAADLYDNIQHEIGDLHEEIQGEIEEYKQVGFKAWVKSNPKTAAGIAIAIVVIAASVIAFVSGLVPSTGA